MEHRLPELPYEMDALAPHISRETVEYHYGKHHQGYVTTLNKLVSESSEYSGLDLEAVVRKAREADDRPLFRAAAQAWNHGFYWRCMSPNGGGRPRGKLADAIEGAFGSFEDFQEEFSARARTHFGSGWCWLVRGEDGKLAVQDTHDAGCPLTHGCTPLLCLDVWEHAYYVDFRNARANYVAAWWDLVAWDFVETQLEG